MTDLETRQPAPRQDNLDPALFGQTPSQTVGPFFHFGLPWKGGGGTEPRNAGSSSRRDRDADASERNVLVF